MKTHDMGDGGAGGGNFFEGTLPDELMWTDADFDAVWALHPEAKHKIKIHGRLVETPRWQQAHLTWFALAQTRWAHGCIWRFNAQLPSDPPPRPATLT